MGKVTDLLIKLDGDVNVFALGDTIKGQVILEVSDEKDRGLNKVKGIWVQYRGDGKAKWSEEANVSAGDVDVSIKFKNKAKEDYFDSVDVLFGAGEDDPVIKDLEIPPGTHTYPFEYVLPYETMPAPYEGQYGYVMYTVEATVSLERAIVNTDHKTEKRFSMIGPEVDLNVLPGMKVPIEREEQVNSYCGCGSTVELSISARMPKQGYVSGEPIYIDGQIDNKDKDEHMVLKAKLVQEVTYRTTSDTKIKQFTMAKASVDIECPKGRMTEYKLPLLIPPLPPSGLPGCDFISITYEVQISNKRCDFGMKFPVTIGTVPLRSRSPKKSDKAEATENQTEDAGEEDAVVVDDDETPTMSFKEPDIKAPAFDWKPNYHHQADFLPSYRYFHFTVDPLPEPKN